MLLCVQSNVYTHSVEHLHVALCVPNHGLLGISVPLARPLCIAVRSVLVQKSREITKLWRLISEWSNILEHPRIT